MIARGARRDRALPAAPREHRRRRRHARALVRGARRADRGRRRRRAARRLPRLLPPARLGLRHPHGRRRSTRCSTTATRVVGLDRLGSLHLNDSQTPLGSNRDRHADVGEGELGEDGLRGVPVRAALRRPAVRPRDARAGQARADAEQIAAARAGCARAAAARPSAATRGLNGGHAATWSTSSGRPDRGLHAISATPRPRSSGRARGRSRYAYRLGERTRSAGTPQLTAATDARAAAPAPALRRRRGVASRPAAPPARGCARARRAGSASARRGSRSPSRSVRGPRGGVRSRARPRSRRGGCSSTCLSSSITDAGSARGVEPQRAAAAAPTGARAARGLARRLDLLGRRLEALDRPGRSSARPCRVLVVDAAAHEHDRVDRRARPRTPRAPCRRRASRPSPRGRRAWRTSSGRPSSCGSSSPAVMMPPTVTQSPSRCSASSRERAVDRRAQRLAHLLERVRGDEQADRLLLDREQLGLVELLGRDRRVAGAANAAAAAPPPSPPHRRGRRSSPGRSARPAGPSARRPAPARARASMPLRVAPVEPNAPHLISASIAFLLTARGVDARAEVPERRRTGRPPRAPP